MYHDIYLVLPLFQSEANLRDGKKKTSFVKSVKMSTYLVCFAVHQFTSVERESNRGIPVSMASGNISLSQRAF